MTDNEDLSTRPYGQDSDDVDVDSDDSDDVDMTTDDDREPMPREMVEHEGQWMTLKVAADRYPVSVKTIRRRIKDGKVVAQRDETDPQAPYMLREDSLTEQFGPPKEIEKPVELQPPAAIELKELIDGYRDMLHDLQDAYRAEAIAIAKAEHLGERIVEVRSDREEIKEERDDLRAERDSLIEEVADIRRRRRTDSERHQQQVAELSKRPWWQRMWDT